jgi:hypothetical protein
LLVGRHRLLLLLFLLLARLPLLPPLPQGCWVVQHKLQHGAVVPLQELCIAAGIGLVLLLLLQQLVLDQQAGRLGVDQGRPCSRTAGGWRGAGRAGMYQAAVL